MYTFIQTGLAIAYQLDLNLHRINVQTAFFNGELKEEIHMEKTAELLVCKLNKSLYGLKQASKRWFKTIYTFLKDSGYEQCKSDSCLYIERV